MDTNAAKTLNEIFKYVVVGGSIMMGMAASLYAYFLALQSLQFIGKLCSKKIHSKKELEQRINQEAGKLGLDSSKIDIEYNANKTEAGKYKDKERYLVRIKGGTDCSTAMIRHELYHILKDCDKKFLKSFLYYILIAEPRAILYGCFKIKL